MTIDQYAENPVRELLHEVVHSLQLTEGFAHYLTEALRDPLFQAYLNDRAI